MNSTSQSDKPPIDLPIHSSQEDALSRAPAAHEFAQTIRDLDSRNGLVVGVLGPWGHGKSSFINLMREKFAEGPALTVVDFNPWLFSGSHQLMEFFFSELASELKVHDKKFAKIADWLNDYAGLLTPVASFIPVPGAAAVAGVAENVIKGASNSTRDKSTVREMRSILTEALLKLEEPIVVVIDDLDRLTRDEIREIFKLVRLTASFPNLIYVLAFDRARVEGALDEQGIPGRAYLEKIIQLAYDVPRISEELLRSRTFDELNRIMGDIDDETFDADRWNGIYFDVIEPMLANLRDVTRYALSARATVRGLLGKVSIVDVLAMEAVRVFRPELFQGISDARRELTSDSGGGADESRSKQRITALIDWRLPEVENSEGDKELVRDTIRRLFPAAQHLFEGHTSYQGSEDRWKREHRIANAGYLAFYMDRVAPSDLDAFQMAEIAYASLNDEKELDRYLRSVDPLKLQDVLQGLEAYQDSYPNDAVVPASRVLLNLIDLIPEKKNRGMLDLSRPDIAVSRVVLRLLRSVKNEIDREAMAEEILSQLKTYSSESDFLELIGYREGVGHKLVSEMFAKEHEAAFMRKVLRKLPNDAQAAHEWGALRVYYLAAKSEESKKAPLTGDESPALLKAVLESSKSENRSWSGDGAASVTEVLAWDPLVEVFGKEENIRRAANKLRESQPNLPILQLLDRYFEGWRPRSFASDDDDD